MLQAQERKKKLIKLTSTFLSARFMRGARAAPWFTAPVAAKSNRRKSGRKVGPKKPRKPSAVAASLEAARAAAAGALPLALLLERERRPRVSPSPQVSDHLQMPTERVASTRRRAAAAAAAPTTRRAPRFPRAAGASRKTSLETVTRTVRRQGYPVSSKPRFREPTVEEDLEAEMAAFLRNHRRVERAEVTALEIQAWWRAAKIKRNYNKYIARRRTYVRDHLVALHRLSQALRMHRASAYTLAFRAWRRGLKLWSLEKQRKIASRAASRQQSARDAKSGRGSRSSRGEGAMAGAGASGSHPATRDGAFSPLSHAVAPRAHVRRKATMGALRTRGLADMWPGELAHLAFNMWHRLVVVQLYRKRGNVGMPHFEKPLKQWDHWVDCENQRAVRELKAKSLFSPALKRRAFDQWHSKCTGKKDMIRKAGVALQFFNSSFQERCLHAWHDFSQNRGRRRRWTRTILFEWLLWAKKNRRETQILSVCGAKQGAKLQAWAVTRWRMQAATQRQERLDIIKHLLLPGNALVALTTITTWQAAVSNKVGGSRATNWLCFARCWQAWSRFGKRRRAFVHTLFEHRRGYVDSLRSRVLLAWRDVVDAAKGEALLAEAGEGEEKTASDESDRRPSLCINDAEGLDVVQLMARELPAASHFNLITRDDVDNPLGPDALHIAADEGDAAAVRDLLLRGYDPNMPRSLGSKEDRGATPLHLASSYTSKGVGYLECVTMLLQAGGDIQQVDGEGRTPLQRTTNAEVELLLMAHKERTLGAARNAKFAPEGSPRPVASRGGGVAPLSARSGRAMLSRSATSFSFKLASDDDGAVAPAFTNEERRRFRNYMVGCRWTDDVVPFRHLLGECVEKLIRVRRDQAALIDIHSAATKVAAGGSMLDGYATFGDGDDSTPIGDGSSGASFFAMRRTDGVDDEIQNGFRLEGQLSGAQWLERYAERALVMKYERDAEERLVDIEMARWRELRTVLPRRWLWMKLKGTLKSFPDRLTVDARNTDHLDGEGPSNAKRVMHTAPILEVNFGGRLVLMTKFGLKSLTKSYELIHSAMPGLLTVPHNNRDEVNVSLARQCTIHDMLAREGERAQESLQERSSELRVMQEARKRNETELVGLGRRLKTMQSEMHKVKMRFESDSKKLVRQKRDLKNKIAAIREAKEAEDGETSESSDGEASSGDTDALERALREAKAAEQMKRMEHDVDTAKLIKDIDTVAARRAAVQEEDQALQQSISGSEKSCAMLQKQVQEVGREQTKTQRTESHLNGLITKWIAADAPGPESVAAGEAPVSLEGAEVSGKQLEESKPCSRRSRRGAPAAAEKTSSSTDRQVVSEVVENGIVAAPSLSLAAVPDEDPREARRRRLASSGAQSPTATLSETKGEHQSLRHRHKALDSSILKPRAQILKPTTSTSSKAEKAAHPKHHKGSRRKKRAHQSESAAHRKHGRSSKKKDKIPHHDDMEHVHPPDELSGPSTMAERYKESQELIFEVERAQRNDPSFVMKQESEGQKKKDADAIAALVAADAASVASRPGTAGTSASASTRASFRPGSASSKAGGDFFTSGMQPLYAFGNFTNGGDGASAWDSEDEEETVASAARKKAAEAQPDVVWTDSDNSHKRCFSLEQHRRQTAAHGADLFLELAKTVVDDVNVLVGVHGESFVYTSHMRSRQGRGSRTRRNSRKNGSFTSSRSGSGSHGDAASTNSGQSGDSRTSERLENTLSALEKLVMIKNKKQSKVRKKLSRRTRRSSSSAARSLSKRNAIAASHRAGREVSAASGSYKASSGLQRFKQRAGLRKMTSLRKISSEVRDPLIGAVFGGGARDMPYADEMLSDDEDDSMMFGGIEHVDTFMNAINSEKKKSALLDSSSPRASSPSAGVASGRRGRQCGALQVGDATPRSSVSPQNSPAAGGVVSASSVLLGEGARPRRGSGMSTSGFTLNDLQLPEQLTRHASYNNSPTAWEEHSKSPRSPSPVGRTIKRMAQPDVSLFAEDDGPLAAKPRDPELAEALGSFGITVRTPHAAHGSHGGPSVDLTLSGQGRGGGSTAVEKSVRDADAVVGGTATRSRDGGRLIKSKDKHRAGESTHTVIGALEMLGAPAPTEIRSGVQAAKVAENKKVNQAIRRAIAAAHFASTSAHKLCLVAEKAVQRALDRGSGGGRFGKFNDNEAMAILETLKPKEYTTTETWLKAWRTEVEDAALADFWAEEEEINSLSPYIRRAEDRIEHAQDVWKKFARKPISNGVAEAYAALELSMFDDDVAEEAERKERTKALELQQVIMREQERLAQIEQARLRAIDLAEIKQRKAKKKADRAAAKSAAKKRARICDAALRVARASADAASHSAVEAVQSVLGANELRRLSFLAANDATKIALYAANAAKDAWRSAHRTYAAAATRALYAAGPAAKVASACATAARKAARRAAHSAKRAEAVGEAARRKKAMRKKKVDEMNAKKAQEAAARLEAAEELRRVATSRQEAETEAARALFSEAKGVVKPSAHERLQAEIEAAANVAAAAVAAATSPTSRSSAAAHMAPVGEISPWKSDLPASRAATPDSLGAALRDPSTPVRAESRAGAAEVTPQPSAAAPAASTPAAAVSAEQALAPVAAPATMEATELSSSVPIAKSVEAATATAAAAPTAAATATESGEATAMAAAPQPAIVAATTVVPAVVPAAVAVAPAAVAATAAGEEQSPLVDSQSDSPSDSPSVASPPLLAPSGLMKHIGTTSSDSRRAARAEAPLSYLQESEESSDDNDFEFHGSVADRFELLRRSAHLEEMQAESAHDNPLDRLHSLFEDAKDDEPVGPDAAELALLS